MKKWKIAIVGAGYMAQEHAKAFASLRSIELVGIYSRTRARAAALADRYGMKVCDSVEELYRETRADAVVVAVTELSMAEVCYSCFSFPWICLLEKPVGVDLAEAERIFGASKSGNVRAFVALNRRSYSATRQALVELKNDTSPRLISVLDQQDMSSVRELGFPERVVQNWMFANSLHLIDYFYSLGRGDIIEIDRVSPWNQSAPGLVVATLKFSSGDVGVYQAVWNGPGPWSVSVTNESVRLEMRPLEVLGIQRRGERRLTPFASDTIDNEFKPGLHYQADQLVSILAGGTATLPTLGEATRSMRLCADIYGLAGD